MSQSAPKKFNFTIKKQILTKKRFFYYKAEQAAAGAKKTLLSSEFGGNIEAFPIKTLKLSLKDGMS